MNIDSFLKTIHSREVELGSKVACDETFKIMFTLLTLALVQGRMVALIFFFKDTITYFSKTFDGTIFGPLPCGSIYMGHFLYI